MIGPGELPLDGDLAPPRPAAADAPLCPLPPARSTAARAASSLDPATPTLAPDEPGHSPAGLRHWLVNTILRPAFRPIRATLNVWRWADLNVVLDGRGTGQPGSYDSYKTPWTRALQETFTDPRWDEDHWIKSSRAGATEGALNCIRFMPDHAPGPVLFAIHSAKQGVATNKNRLIATLKHATDDPSVDKRTDVTGAMIRLPNMIIKITGSHNEEAFRSDGYRLVVGDEIEVVDEIEGSGSLHNLMRSRIEGIQDKKLITMSKPKRWCSAHHREVASGTLDAYLVPCPHCGVFQELSLDGTSPTHTLRIEKPLRPGLPPISPPLAVKAPAPLGRLVYSHCTDLTGAWDWERILTDTYYQCVSGCRITGEEQLDATHAWIFPGADEPTTRVRTELLSGKKLRAKWCMENAGRWFSTNPRPIPRQRSHHISDLHSLKEDMTYGRFALKFAKAASDPAAHSTAMNEQMGLPVQETIVGALDDGLVDLLRAPYRAGEFPFRPDIILLGGDTQDAYQKALTIGVRLDGPDYEIAVSDWHYAQTPAALDEIMGTAHPLLPPPSGTTSPGAPTPPDAMRPALGFVDAAGHRTGEVYEQCLQNPSLLPCFGREQRGLKQLVWRTRITHDGREVDIYHVADEKLKKRIYHGMIAKAREIIAAHQARRSPTGGPTLSVLGLPGRLYLPGLPRADETPAEFARRFDELRSELTAEIMDETGVWKKIGARKNDFGDCLKYAIAAFDYIRPDLEADRAARATATMDAAGRITRP